MEKNKLLKKKQKALTSGNNQNYASACNALAGYYASIGMVEPALEEYKNEANAYEKLNKMMDKAKAHRMMGEMFMLLSEFDKALENVNFYLKVSIDKNNSLEQQRAYATIGRIYLLYGQSVSDQTKSTKLLKSAEQYFKRSLEICKELKSTTSKVDIADMQGRLYLNLGITRETIGEYDASINHIEEAIKLCQVYDLYELLYRCYITKGSMFFTKLKDNAKALKFFRLAIDVAGHLDNKTQKICETLLLKSEVLVKAGDYQSAKKDLINCYKLKPSDVNDRKTAEYNLKIIAALCNSEDELYLKPQDDFVGRKILYEKMGDGCCKLKNYSMAIVYYKKMLECVENSECSDTERIPVYVSLYQTYRDMEEYDNALVYLWKEYELELNNAKEAFNTLINIAEVYELVKKDVISIENIYQRAREEAQKLGDKKYEHICVWKLNEYYKTAGMDFKSKVLAAECNLSGINIENLNFDNESETTEEENTPDIGDEMCIEDILANCSDNEEIENSTARPRKRPGLVIKKNAKGETQLHQACISGSEILVTRLLEQGHPVMVRDHAGWLPIHEACNNGYIEIVKKLIEKGEKAQINDKGGMQCDGITPLHDACFNGHLDIVELLLDNGANVNLRTDSGDTPIDSLERWYKDATLNYDTQAHYTTIHERLSKLIKTTTPTKVAGLSNTDKTTIIDPTPSTSYRTTRSQPKPSHSRNLMDFEYDDDIIPSKNLIDDEYTDSDDDDEKNVFVHTAPGSSNKIAKQAKLDYQQVMKNLRGKHDTSPNKNRPSVQSKNSGDRSTKRAAYLTSNEIDDDWLDDDMGPNKKRQKFLNDSLFNRSSSISPKKSESTNRSPQKLNVTAPLPIYNSDSELSQDPFEHNDIIESAINSSLKKTGRNRLSLKKSTPIQSSLIQAGFTRYSQDSSSSQNSLRRNSLQSTLIDSTSPVDISRTQNSSRLENSCSVAKTTMSIKVKVDENLFVIAVDATKLNELNIGWLADQASERYYKMYNVRPKLQLTTSDGAFFQDIDPLVLVIDNSSSGTIVSSKVTDWIKPPLNERYKDICGAMKFEYDKYLSDLLKTCNLNNVIDLSNQELDSKQIQPVLTALNCETELFELNLSRNCILDEGIKHLVDLLPKLDRLHKLDLSGNFILSEGVGYLNKVFNRKPNALMNLYELNLNFNPIGDKGLKSLVPFINNLLNLKKLHLSNCDIVNFTNNSDPIKLYNLILFDISFNDKLKKDSVKKILNLLNPAILQTLNFAFSVSYPEFYIDLINFFKLNGNSSGTDARKTLNELNLINCKLSDIHVSLIFDVLKTNYGQIKTLRLSQNDLSVATFERILNGCAEIFIEEIYLNGCNDLIKGFTDSSLIGDEEMNQKFPYLINLSFPRENDGYNIDKEVECLRNFWEKCWGDEACIFVNNTAVKLSRRKNF